MNNAGKATLFDPMPTTGSRRCSNRRGQTLVEYALILAFISVVAVGVLISMTKQVNILYSTIGSAISTSQASH
jgi:Flp pilus assembly pilin Flp